MMNAATPSDLMVLAQTWTDRYPAYFVQPSPRDLGVAAGQTAARRDREGLPRARRSYDPRWGMSEIRAYDEGYAAGLAGEAQ